MFDFRARKHDMSTEADDLLTDYIGGRCTPERVGQAEAYLAAHPELRDQVEDTRYVVALLNATPAAPVPRSFAITREHLSRDDRPALVRFWVSSSRAVAVVAATLALAFFIYGSGGTQVELTAASLMPSDQNTADVAAPEASQAVSPALPAATVVATHPAEDAAPRGWISRNKGSAEVPGADSTVLAAAGEQDDNSISAQGETRSPLSKAPALDTARPAVMAAPAELGSTHLRTGPATDKTEYLPTQVASVTEEGEVSYAAAPQPTPVDSGVSWLLVALLALASLAALLTALLERAGKLAGPHAYPANLRD